MRQSKLIWTFCIKVFAYTFVIGYSICAQFMTMEFSIRDRQRYASPQLYLSISLWFVIYIFGMTWTSHAFSWALTVCFRSRVIWVSERNESLPPIHRERNGYHYQCGIAVIGKNCRVCLFVLFFSSFFFFFAVSVLMFASLRLSCVFPLVVLSHCDCGTKTSVNFNFPSRHSLTQLHWHWKFERERK